MKMLRSTAAPACSSHSQRQCQLDEPKRPRTLKACLSCRTRKVRCDALQVGVPCTKCKLNDFECSITSRKKRRKKGDLPKPSVDHNRMHGLLPRSIPEHIMLHQVPHYPFFQGFQSSGHPWLQARDKENGVLLPVPGCDRSTSSNPVQSTLAADDFEFLRSRGALVLPSRAILDRCVSIYFQIFHPFFPVIDKPVFLDQYRSSDQDTLLHGGGISLLLLQAIIFTSILHLPNERIRDMGFSSKKQARSTLYTRALYLHKLDFEPNDVVTIQALLLLSHHYPSMVEQRHTWYWVHQAIRLAQGTGLHRDPGDVPQRKLWARIWWACLVRDRLISLGTGRPMHINSLNCSVAERLVGKTLGELTENMGKTWRYLVSDSQLRWVGPEKGVMHLGLSACVNALWDLWGRYLNKPVWKLVSDMTPEEFVACIDFRYIRDAITPEEAVALLKEQEPTKEERIQIAEINQAVPAYTTQAGWLGFSDESMIELIRENLATGMDKFKLEVGGNIEDDKRRLKTARDVIGYERMLMVDANQVWGVQEAIEAMKQLAEYKPTFIEEPTSPDDVLGHAAIRQALKPFGIGVATGEHCQNRIIFKQLLQAGSIDYCQMDACRLGGVNEVMAVLLMSKKFNIPIVPHSGGIGLNEYTQHLALIHYICVAGEKSLLEHINSFSEMLKYPVQTSNGYFVTPWEAGYSVAYKPEALEIYQYPSGSFWQSEKGMAIRNGLKA